MFKSVAQTRSAQAAMMVLKPGEDTGEPQNEHAGSEQWLYVVSGSGRALVNKRKVKIAEGSLLLIEKGEVHQVKNTGNSPLVTLNLYVPPAYAEDGEPLKRRHLLRSLLTK
jgi:mannose-6-phosphate isomerase-like protein (cupin superfamily)